MPGAIKAAPEGAISITVDCGSLIEAYLDPEGPEHNSRNLETSSAVPILEGAIMEWTEGCVVVGVVPGQPTDVVKVAATFAERFNADLVCVSVDVWRRTVGHSRDGTTLATSYEGDLVYEVEEEFEPALRDRIAEALDPRAVRWSTRALAGNPAQQLAGLAEQLDAAMIVVGTREPGIRGTMHEFFDGSAAVQLAHSQQRPVVVVPLHPVDV